MSTLTPILGTLLERLAEFVRDDRCKLLHVRVGVELRAAAVELARAQEHRPDNRAPFVLFEQDHSADAPGWTARSTYARAQHELRREGAEPPLAALPDSPTGGPTGGPNASGERVAFALQLQQLLAVNPPECDGLVVVLAPILVESPQQWRESVELFVGQSPLAPVRWIVIETEVCTVDALVRALGDRARAIDARVSSELAVAGLQQLAAGRTRAGPTGVRPPARPDVASSLPDADGERRIALRQLLLAAALASSRGRAAQAIDAQRRAREICESAGWHGEAVTMELVLGGHLVAAGAVHEAESSFLRAIEAARAHALPDKIATAGFGLGAVRTVRGERHTALVAYAEAALAAEDSGSPLLAIEGSRLAGQAALDLKMEPQAITFLGRAVRLAQESTADVSRSSAAIAARTLATLCRRRRLPARAAELQAMADEFAAGRKVVHEPPAVREVPVVPEAPAPSPAPILETTELLTLEEIAAVHWGGVIDDPSPPVEGSRSWTRDEIHVLQRAVDHSLDVETTSMLSAGELSALRGHSVQQATEPEPPEPSLIATREPPGERSTVEEPPPEQPPENQPTSPPEGDAFATALAHLLAFGEGRMVMRKEELELIRKRLLAQREPEEGEDG